MKPNDMPELNNQFRLYAREQEQSVLGALLIDNNAVDRMGDLKSDHFFSYEHRKIFDAILQLVLMSKAADVITVFDRLRSNGFDSVDLPYLNALAQNTPSSSNIARYADIVRDRALKRGLVAICRETEDSVMNCADDAGMLVDKASSRLDGLAHTATDSEPKLAFETLARHIELIDDRFNGAEVAAISTGLIDIDRKLNGGLRRGNLIVLAGRPKMGKTSLALNIAEHVSVDGIAAIFSMEMTEPELHDRNLASIGRIPLDHLTDSKKLTDQDWPRLTNAVQKMLGMRLYRDFKPGLRLLDVRTKAKQIKRKAGGLDLLVIDYLQLMAGEGANRNAEIEGVTRGLKNLAKELDVPIILLSQLNRKLEDRPQKRPQPADLRDSGSIEQDADIVIFLYRDEVYNPDSMDKGVCEVNVALSRQGAPGVVALTYIGEFTKFENLTRSWHPEPPKKPPSKSRGFPE